MKPAFLLLVSLAVFDLPGRAQSADWTEVVWREPQVRYLLADLTLGGSVKLYRDYATTERDPDSREAIRLWDAGARVVNTNEFERRWVTNQFGKDGRVMRVVLRGSDRTTTGNEVLLTSDIGLDQRVIREVIGCLTRGARHENFHGRAKKDRAVSEALRRFNAGARMLNGDWFDLQSTWATVRLVYRGTKTPVDPAHIRLNSDLAYPEVNVRYFLADMMLGGSRDFYHRTAEAAHEMGCQEAVARFDAGVKITNLDQFERKQVDRKILITRKGANERISGMLVKLSSD
ncbi:MAG TPA: hypothetical protein VN887_00350 [Candidatus Angelobacter sp.]|nr:hypothetical protein [Candidatus Angelobacter sp.]